MATRSAILSSGRALSTRKRAVVAIQAFKGIELPIQFVLSILAARALPPSQFGIATILSSVQALYVAIATFGFDEMIQRALARSLPADEAGILATALRARAVSAGSGLVLAALGALAFSAGHDYSLAVSVLLLGVASSTMVAANGYLSIGLARYSVVTPALSSLLSWVLPVALVIAGAVNSTETYIGALAAGSALRLLISFAWHRRTALIPRGLRKQLHTSPALLKTPRAHLSIATYNVTDLVLARHGDVFVAGLVGIATASIGAYGLAFQVTAACNQFLLLGVGALALTRMSEERDSSAGLLATWRQLTVVAATLAIGPLCLVVLGAPELVKFALGSRYPHLVMIIDALAATQWAARIGGGGTNITALIAIGRMGYVARTALIGASINLVLDACLAPLLGVYGLALGSAMATLVIGAANIQRIVRESRSMLGAPTGSDGSGTGLMHAFPVRRLAVLTVIFASVEFVGVSEAPVRVRLGLGALVGALWIISCVRELQPGIFGAPLRALRATAAPGFIGLPAALIIASVAVGAAAAERPRSAATLLEIALFAAVLLSARRWLSVRQRSGLAALVIGVGELAAPLGAASSALLCLLVLAAMPRIVWSWSPARIAWLVGSGCLAASVLLTSGSARVSASVVLGLIAALAASSWMFATATEGDGWPAAPGFDIVENAGVIAAGFVILSYLLGHSLVSTTTHALTDTLVAGGTTRASGSFTSPNEAGLVISAGLLATIVRAALDPAVRVLSVRRILGTGCALVALVLTGSRGGVLGLTLGCIIVIIGTIRRRPILIGGVGAFGILAIFAGSAFGTFTGRGLDVLSSSDPSSQYRRYITHYLLARIDWTQLRGFGFSVGNQLAHNPVSGTLPNVDEAWLYLVLTLGALSVLGVGLIGVASIMRSFGKRGIVALSGIAWVAVISPSENLFVLAGPSVCAMFLVGCVGTNVDAFP